MSVKKQILLKFLGTDRVDRVFYEKNLPFGAFGRHGRGEVEDGDDCSSQTGEV